MGFVDLHSHVLPGIDDGAQQISESLEMIALLREIGFEVVHATPHQKVGSFVPTAEEIAAAHSRVLAALPANSPTVKVGAENMWDELFLERSLTKNIPGYRATVEATDARAFLFELPVSVLPPKIEERLFAVRRSGPLPVMAHPERYVGLWDDKDRYEALGRQAALLVDLGALDGAHGAKQCKMARWLVESGLAHGAASDIHGAADGKSAAAGIAWVKKRLGPEGVTRLLDTGPRQILNGELPD